MITINRLHETEIYENLPRLRQLIQKACAPQTAAVDDYTRVLLHSIYSDTVLPLGVFHNGVIKGLLIAAIGQAYDRPAAVCHIMLLSIERPVILRGIYQDLRKHIFNWCSTHKVDSIISSSPRPGFARLLTQLDKWQIVQTYKLEMGGNQ